MGTKNTLQTRQISISISHEEYAALDRLRDGRSLSATATDVLRRGLEVDRLAELKATTEADPAPAVPTARRPRKAKATPATPTPATPTPAAAADVRAELAQLAKWADAQRLPTVDRLGCVITDLEDAGVDVQVLRDATDELEAVREDPGSYDEDDKDMARWAVRRACQEIVVRVAIEARGGTLAQPKYRGPWVVTEADGTVTEHSELPSIK